MNNFPEYTSNRETKSYLQIIAKISRTAKVVVQNDLRIMTTELKKIGSEVKGETAKIAIFGYIFMISAIPLLVFAILALGNALNGQYWLSALIIGVTLCVAGIVGMSYAYKKLTSLNFKLSKTRSALKREGEIISREFNRLQNEVSRAAQ